ncbi:hypothetical protein FAES_1885 [Fibrella aestuarina BUZ 2]|uniref:Uncharacterized protein n=1 Tax=Fibrella aestuarina BUZ 2 TaxID=1166018 RepID=I0K6Z1_9BACT|nr:hypothetical protein [Fibrella aestuarina]CCG99894.1 hypothetical protein FAES_1885 [Fibrella aestuarina BUZ 2]
MKLRDTLLLCAFIGALLLWLLEVLRVGFSSSYDLLLFALIFLFAFQYFRQRDRQASKDVSPTIRQMAEDRKKANSTKKVKPQSGKN